MARHPRDLFSLICGLVLVTVGALYLLSDAGQVDVNLRWLLPAALIALGTAGLLGSLRRPAAAERVGRPGEQPAGGREGED